MTEEARAHNGVKIVSSINGVGKSGLVGTSKKIKLDHQLTPYTRINVKWIKDLNISHGTIKVLKENIGSKISDILHSNTFADKSSRAREMKEKITCYTGKVTKKSDS